MSAGKLNSHNSKCINIFDVGENYSNTKKPTNNLLLEQECQINSKLEIREFV
jgi:hypothetical protein